MSHADDEVTMEIHTLLGTYMKDKDADRIIQIIDELDETNFCEFVRLMQKWLACR